MYEKKENSVENGTTLHKYMFLEFISTKLTSKLESEGFVYGFLTFYAGSLPLKHSLETDLGGRRLFSKAAGAIFLQNENNRTRRGNVWDRLGMLTEKNGSLTVNTSEGDNIHRQTSEQNSMGLGQNTLMPTVEDNKVKQNWSENCCVKTYRSNGGTKRQLNDLFPISGSTSVSPDHEKENFRKVRRQSEKYTNMLKESGTSSQSEQSKSYNKCCTSGFDASGSSKPENISQEKLSMEALGPTQTLISHSDLPVATRGIRPVQAVRKDLLEKTIFYFLEARMSLLN